ncbi:MAG: PQQ-dependent sugar dehydrogenase [Pseudomonadota bacterium]|nr:PQQ-dependent sugar dehydrogenase [Pseudomonadota bacterium]
MLLPCLPLLASCAATAAPPRIHLPPGFAIDVYADNVPNARVMALGDKGTLFVSTRNAGNVYALRDEDGDGRAERVITLLKDLQMPNGIALRDGDLYVAAVDRILRYDAIEEHLDAPPEPSLITDSLPDDTAHGWRYIAFGPDGKLYVAVGAPCNICNAPGYAQIRRMDPDGSPMEVFAEGVRNTVGFTWHPQTGVLWFTDNGRDWLGDDRPPDELNRAPGPGLHFGYPYCHGRDLPDPEFGRGRNCAEFTPAVQELGPHVAALGVIFYTGGQFPAEYRGQAFIAEHGSWNRSERIGYRISLVTLDGDRAVSYKPFAEGWLDDGQVHGRPAYLLVLPDGSLLVSDDDAGIIYRIRYSPKA